MIQVVLVDKKGKELGLMEKLGAHQNPGRLHKAVSVVLYKKTGKRVEVLLQKRAKAKLLWPGYWANTVCTHPLPGESNLDGAVRRLREEVGIVIKAEALRELYSFYYQADYNQNLSEHELDAVVVGEYNGKYLGNLEEVDDLRWLEWRGLMHEMVEKPDCFTPWFKTLVKEKRFQRELNV